MKIRPGIIGIGNVGTALVDLLYREGMEPILFDPYQGYRDKDPINDLCDVAFISVPTPGELNTGTLDTSIVEETLIWLQVPLAIIVSTVNVGDTDRWRRDIREAAVYAPEWGPGSSPQHLFADIGDRDFIVLGGPRHLTELAQEVYQHFYPATVRYHHMTAKAAEITKLSENSFFSVKLSYFQEIKMICDLHGVNYEDVRRALGDDPRIGASHTLALQGWGGSHCLPKDTDALVAAGLGRASMAAAAIRSNAEYEEGEF